MDQVLNHFHACSNHFPELEQVAEEDWRVGDFDQSDLFNGLVGFVDSQMGLRIKVVPVDVMSGFRRRYDRHGRRVLLSELLTPAGRCFELAAQICLIRHADLLDTMVARAELTSEEARAFARQGFANYYAAAVLMPYDKIYRAAQAVRYDLEVLSRRFAVGYEQLAQRLTTLQRPGARGVPFFMMRVDQAGNISKRFSADGGHFARVGGACPRWMVHSAFRSTNRVQVQLVELPDGQRYFTLAVAITRVGAGFRSPGPSYVIAIGCETDYAAQLIYADGMSMSDDLTVEPIGTHCRLCERPDCSFRALPPVDARLTVDDMIRQDSPYKFEVP